MSATSSNRDQLLTDWKEAKRVLDASKALEAELRAQVVDAFSDHAAFPEDASGTENIDIGWGHKLKVVHKLNYTLDNANDSERLDKVLTAIENGMTGGDIIAARIVKWKPELSLTEYKLLTPANKALIDSVLTVKPGSKEVTIIPPKGS